MDQKDVVFIGGGPAGYVGAIRAARLGAKVALIEADTLGGTCLNRGCIPTRALWRGVEFIDLVRKAKEYGVNYGAAEVDFAKMMARKEMVVKTTVGGVQLLMEANGIEVLKGKGTILSSAEVEAVLDGGSSRRLKAGKIIITTGCRYDVPAVPGAEAIITTDHALSLKEVPKSLIILGGGEVALAFATIFCKLGAAVTILEASDRILSEVDGEIVSMLEKELKKEKIRIQTGARIQAVRPGAANEKEVVFDVKGEEMSLTAQTVLLTDGRRANVEGIGLEKAGVRLEGGYIAVNGRMETSAPGIFAAGDVVGMPHLAHVAFTEGMTAVENALGGNAEMDYTVVPRCVNTYPEVASLGLTEARAKDEGYDLQIGRFSFGASGMATILGERVGVIKVITDKKYGQILGVHIIGPRASNLIPEAALAMKLDATPVEIASTIHPHPTLSEAMMEAALDVNGDTIHSISANKK